MQLNLAFAYERRVAIREAWLSQYKRNDIISLQRVRGGFYDVSAYRPMYLARFSRADLGRPFTPHAKIHRAINPRRRSGTVLVYSRAEPDERKNRRKACRSLNELKITRRTGQPSETVRHKGRAKLMENGVVVSRERGRANLEDVWHDSRDGGLLRRNVRT